MDSFRAYLVVSAVAGAVLLAPSRAASQPADSAQATRRAEEEFARLRSDLDRVNAEIADLKRASRSMRNDYRLRERMADAEALAQRLIQAEKRLRALGVVRSSADRATALTAPPQALPQDGSVELEAKADLLADRAGRLAREADVLATAAADLRGRRALRRRAGAWDRDPFTSLEASKRNLAISASSPKPAGSYASDSPSRAGSTPPPSGAPSSPGESVTLSPSAPNSPPSATPGALPATPQVATSGAASDGSSRSTPILAPTESATVSKTSPLPATAATDHRSLDQRFYLDPTTAAELRQALGTGATLSDPDALERAAAALRARARALASQAETLRARSRAP